MNDELTGKEFGGALERLRQAARIDLPKLADEYSQVRDDIDSGSSVDEKLNHDSYFGPNVLKADWTPLRDLIWTASGQSGDNIWALAGGLDGAVESFAEQDGAAATELDKERKKLENDGDASNNEWQDGYDKGDTPAWKEPAA